MEFAAASVNRHTHVQHSRRPNFERRENQARGDDDIGRRRLIFRQISDQILLILQGRNLDRFLGNGSIVARYVASRDHRGVRLRRGGENVEVDAEFRQCQRKFAPDEHHGVVAADETEFPAGLVANVVAENAIAIPLHYWHPNVIALRWVPGDLACAAPYPIRRHCGR